MKAISWPLSGRISSPFGDKRNRPRPHTGTDITGTGAITAGATGVVHHVGPNSAGPSSGNVVTIKYELSVGTLYAMYCHVDDAWYPVEVGETVWLGTDIALVGDSGTGDGAHVHIECYLNGRLVNPEHYFDGVVPASTSLTPIATNTEEDTMKHFYTRDNGGHLWTLVNTATGKIIQSRDPIDGTSWNAAWGTARELGIQDFLNVLDAVKKTTPA